MEDSTPEECRTPYSMDIEDKRSYRNSWKRLVTNMSEVTSTSAWIYHSATELDTYSMQCKRHIYSGGGYVVLLLTTKTHQKKVLRILQQLQDQKWVDIGTRVIFVEFTVFNPTTKIFGMVMLAFEFASAGTVDPYRDIVTVQLYSLTKTWSFSLITYVTIYLLFVIWHTMHVCNTMWQMRRRLMQYFTNIWTLPDWITVLLTYVSVIMFIMRLLINRMTLNQVKNSKCEAFVSFYLAVAWEVALIRVVGVIIVLLNISVLKLTSYASKRHALFASAIPGIACSVICVICLYIATFLVTLTMSVLLFSDSCGGYSTWTEAVIRIVRLYMYDMGGGIGIRCVNEMPLSKLFFLGVVMFCIAMLWRPLLIVCSLILMVSFGKKQTLQLQEDVDFVDFLWGRLLVFIGFWRMSDFTNHVEYEQAKRMSYLHQRYLTLHEPAS